MIANVRLAVVTCSMMPYDGITLPYSKPQQNPNRISGLVVQDGMRESERGPNMAHQQGDRPHAVLNAEICQGKKTGAGGRREEYQAPASGLGDEVQEAELPQEQGVESPSRSIQALEERGPKDSYSSLNVG